MSQRRTALAAPLLCVALGGCHSWALESQCHRLQVGMSRGIAYRTVTVAPAQCLYRTTQGRFSEIRECGAGDADLPQFVQWERRVFGGTTPDVCRAQLDDKGQISAVDYLQGQLGD